MIGKEKIRQLMETVDIVEVVSEFVPLRKAGNYYRGKCPFHDDNTPSFTVSPAKGIYKCFACGESGDAASFLMKHLGMSFPEALEHLATQFHFDLGKTRESARDKYLESLLLMNNWAAEEYRKALAQEDGTPSAGLAYFRERGIDDETIERFKLGYAPAEKSFLADKAISRGLPKSRLEKLGLCYYSKADKRLCDTFHGRVMFPFFSPSGNVVGFGGRVLDKETKGVAMKYINSPDSDVYHKGETLYGLYQAKREIASENMAYLVEGYTDVLALYQAGIKNVVSTSGTALTEQQMTLLWRYANTITLMFDGDQAGNKATFRSIAGLLRVGFNVNIVSLPNDQDPDAFVKGKSGEDVRQALKALEKDFFDFLISVLRLEENIPIQDKAQGIHTLIDTVNQISDPIKKNLYLNEICRRFNISKEAMAANIS